MCVHYDCVLYHFKNMLALNEGRSRCPERANSAPLAQQSRHVLRASVLDRELREFGANQFGAFFPCPSRTSSPSRIFLVTRPSGATPASHLAQLAC